MKSTIYLKCPECGKNGLLIERQGKYFCANCMYDYTQLNDDRGKLDEVLLENLQVKGFGPLFAIALYERVTLTPPLEARDYVFKLAEDNNIEIMQPTSKLDFLKKPILLIFIEVIVIVIVALVLLSVYV